MNNVKSNYDKYNNYILYFISSYRALSKQTFSWQNKFIENLTCGREH